MGRGSVVVKRVSAGFEPAGLTNWTTSRPPGVGGVALGLRIGCPPPCPSMTARTKARRKEAVSRSANEDEEALGAKSAGVGSAVGCKIAEGCPPQGPDVEG